MLCLPLGITATKCWIPRHCELPSLVDEGEIIDHVGPNFSEYANWNEETCCWIESLPSRWGSTTTEGQAETCTHFPRIRGIILQVDSYLWGKTWWSEYKEHRV